MGTFLTVVSILIALAALVAQFYFRWVPNPEDQKRQVKTVFKRLGIWAWHIFTLGCPAACLFVFTQHQGPVTPRFVAEVAFVACGLSLTASLAIIRILLGNSHLGIMGLASVTRQVVDALCLLANDPNLSAETGNALQILLYGHPQRSK